MRREQHLEAGPRAREREMEREREGGRGERREREGEGARARARARVRGCVSTASVRAARGEEGVEESEIARAWRRRAGAPCGVILTTSEASVDPQGGRVAWGGRGTVLRHPPRSVPCRSLLHGHTFFGVGGSRPRRPLFPRMQPQMLPQRARRTWHRAVPARRLRVPEQARGNISPQKIVVTCESPVGDISVVTLIRTDTTLDHSQKAEKVCRLTTVVEVERACPRPTTASSRASVPLPSSPPLPPTPIPPLLFLFSHHVLRRLVPPPPGSPARLHLRQPFDHAHRQRNSPNVLAAPCIVSRTLPRRAGLPGYARWTPYLALPRIHSYR